MTSEEIIDIALKAGFHAPAPADGYMGLAYDQRGVADTGASLKRFAELVAAHAASAERDACRAECQTLADLLREHNDISGAELAESLAAGIAARGHKTPDAAPQNAVTQAAIRLLTALDKLDEGDNHPGFSGWQNALGEDVGDEAQAAREALEAITGHKEKKA